VKRQFAILLLCLFALTSLACAGNQNSTTNTNSNTTPATNRNSANTASAPPSNHSGSNSTDDAPASVRAAIPDAQTFTTQHRDIPAGTVSEIESATGTRITNRDHHAYLAFSATGGARRQVGAATVVNVSGQEMVIIYDSRDGMPVIREVRGGNLPPAFLNQFRGKDHDAPITFGNDIRAAGDVAEAIARQVTAAIKADVLTMQALYGSPHTH
jgi:hypothetical protein